MIEIIKRREGQASSKEQINGVNSQVSFSSWGHMVVRIIQNPPIPEQEPSFMLDEADTLSEDAPSADTLVVFDRQVSSEIIAFCQEVLKNRQQRPF